VQTYRGKDEEATFKYDGTDFLLLELHLKEYLAQRGPLHQVLPSPGANA